MLNDKDFLLIAGDPREWDEGLRAAMAASPGDQTLVRLQEEQAAMGRESAELVEGMFGWYVRAGTSLMEPGILANTRERGGLLDGSYDAAVAWGTAWANEDPQNREVYVRRSALPTTA